MDALNISPCVDAIFAVQAINKKSKTFWMSLATSLFYTRTGINLGYGLSHSDKIDASLLYVTPNQAVQICLANWIEFYVGSRILGQDITDEGFSKNVMRGDFSALYNDGKTFPPLRAVLNFLNDWYAGSCIQFVKGDISPDAIRRHSEYMTEYNTKLLEFIEPYSCEHVRNALYATSTASFTNIVGICQRELYVNFPAKKLKGRVVSAEPQIIVTEPLYSDNARKVKVHPYMSVSNGTSIIPVPPDISQHGNASCSMFEYIDKCVPMWCTEISLEDILGTDRIILYRMSNYVDNINTHGVFSSLFPIAGSAPTFADRGYCQRVTERVLREITPIIKEYKVRAVMSHIYPGRRVEQGDSVPSPTMIQLTQIGKFSGKEKSHVVIPFSDTRWISIQSELDSIFAFFNSYRFVLENDTHMYIAEHDYGSESGYRAKFRLFSSEFTPDQFGCEPMSNVLDSSTTTDMSGAPKIAVFFSMSDLISVSLNESQDVMNALKKCYDNAYHGYVLSHVFGDPTIVSDIVKYNNEVHSQKRLTVKTTEEPYMTTDLYSPCATYIVFEKDEWDDAYEDINILDITSRYSLCAHVPKDVIGDKKNTWIVAERDTDAEDGTNIVMRKVCRLLAKVCKQSGSHTYKKDSPIKADSIVLTKRKVDHSSSSLHKGLVLNMLQLCLFEIFATAQQKESMRTILQISEPLRYSSGSELERYVMSDIKDVMECCK